MDTLATVQQVSERLQGVKVLFSRQALLLTIHRYTREAGVRSLEREIAGLCRKVAKRVLNLAYDAPLHVGLELEGLAYGLLRSTDDFAEGVAAFTERRPPNYTGT